MKLPRSLEVPGVFKMRANFEADGRPLDLDIASGEMVVKVNGRVYLTASIEPDSLTLDVSSELAKMMFRGAGQSMGWIWMAKKAPGFFKVMQQFADQSGSRLIFKIEGRNLVRFSPGSRPAFGISGIRGIWA